MCIRANVQSWIVLLPPGNRYQPWRITRSSASPSVVPTHTCWTRNQRRVQRRVHCPVYTCVRRDCVLRGGPSRAVERSVKGDTLHVRRDVTARRARQYEWITSVATRFPNLQTTQRRRQIEASRTRSCGCPLRTDRNTLFGASLRRIATCPAPLADCHAFVHTRSESESLAVKTYAGESSGQPVLDDSRLYFDEHATSTCCLIILVILELLPDNPWYLQLPLSLLGVAHNIAANVHGETTNVERSKPPAHHERVQQGNKQHPARS